MTDEEREERSLLRRSLLAISLSGPRDFDTPVQWAEWMNALAAAAIVGKVDRVTSLLRHARRVLAADANPPYQPHTNQGSHGIEGDSGHHSNRYG